MGFLRIRTRSKTGVRLFAERAAGLADQMAEVHDFAWASLTFRGTRGAFIRRSGSEQLQPASHRLRAEIALNGHARFRCVSEWYVKTARRRMISSRRLLCSRRGDTCAACGARCLPRRAETGAWKSKRASQGQDSAAGRGIHLGAVSQQEDINRLWLCRARPIPQCNGGVQKC
jgi:hypothetical protein